MWPWDAGASAPSAKPPSIPGADPAVAVALVPIEADIDLVKPEDVLETEVLGYVYGD